MSGAKAAQSARGLFNAMGKASRPVAVRLPGVDGAAGEIVTMPALERDPLDFQPTPPEPTLALAHAERERLAGFPLIWEPACGDGRMMRDLNACGLPTFGSDIVDRGCGALIRDFFDFAEAPSRAIVTNPPFNAVNWRDGKGRWITHAMEALGVEFMALLLPWGWPGAGGLAPIWAAHPPARVHLMRWKIDFTGQGAPPMLNGWFVWDKAAPAGTQLLMMDRVDGRQGEMFGGGA
jgi:hypothetical protein